MIDKPTSAAAVLARIDRRLTALDMTENFASEQAGSRDTIRSIRKNVRKGTQRGVSTETLERLAPVLRTTVEWLAREVGPETTEQDHIDSAHILHDRGRKGRTVPLVGYVGAGAAAHFYAVAQGHLEEVAAPEEATEQTVACEIRGTSLGSAFDRWLVYYDDVRSPITDDLLGQLCVVGLDDDRVLVKIIQRGKGGKFDLVSNNPEEAPIRSVGIEWAALVNDIKRRR